MDLLENAQVIPFRKCANAPLGNVQLIYFQLSAKPTEYG